MAGGAAFLAVRKPSSGGYGDSAYISSAIQRSLVQRKKCTVTVIPKALGEIPSKAKGAGLGFVRILNQFSTILILYLRRSQRRESGDARHHEARTREKIWQLSDRSAMVQPLSANSTAAMRHLTARRYGGLICGLRPCMLHQIYSLGCCDATNVRRIADVFVCYFRARRNVGPLHRPSQ
jgi:hypothetical protein